MNTSLKIKNDGSFRILQITDLHLVSGKATINKKDKETMRWLSDAIELSKPDLIEFTGDLAGGGVEGRNNAVKEVADFLEEKEIYWAYVFGNHDGEHSEDENGNDIWLGRDGKRTDMLKACSGVKSTFKEETGSIYYGDNARGNKEIFDIIKDYNFCLTRRDPSEAENADLMGVGNFVIDLVNNEGETVFALVHMDSHGKFYVDPKDNDKGNDGCKDAGYTGLTDMQIEWYKNIIKPYAEKGIKSAIFMHVPNYGFREITEELKEINEYGVPQFKELENVKEKVNTFKDTGFLKDEGIYSPRWDEGLEKVMDEYRSTNLIAVGHDHNNCFYLRKNISQKDKNDILLCYGRCSGVNAWGRWAKIGASIYDVNTNGKTIDDIYTISEIYPDFEYSVWDA